MSQREFSRRVGVAQSTIMRIENHEQNVTLNTLEQLCRAFRVDIADLFPAPTIHHRAYGMDEAAARAGVVHEPQASDSTTTSTPASGTRARRRKPRV